MFDFASDHAVRSVPLDIVDAETLSQAISSLADDELAALEDDLDFCSFAGVPSTRILRVLSKVTDLDAGWDRQLRVEADPLVPQVY